MLKRLTLLSILSLGILVNSFAQQDCQEIKVALEKTKAENEYLKNSLKIGKALKEFNTDHILFKLTKVEGDSKAQTVTCTIVLTTSAANWYINSDVRSIIDIDGNEYRLKSFTNGASDYLTAIQLNTDVPIKCTYTFEGILPAVKMIKLFKFGYSHSLGEPYFVDFKDLSIDWK
ncbi:MAG: hypothetical protein K0R59_526 [Sphingobacterium sp.]|jgi:hypothetical protein|nr:hypothetical protein [Sphingobacterium sp.]